ncbi:site-specific integrase [Massilia aquatica]|uniref:Site-specific integrase n=1 Tax=Massilia aquatica TaxID=2609000 RepID=A0ABX0LV41_9BURK|nr:site-specific integrase [Massilia aquatica]NHZ38585.1 site-specific integrase [Massilia aquatica]
MATFRQRSGTWQARVRVKGFPVETKSFDSKAAAQRWAREIESSMDNGGHQHSSKGAEILLREVLQRYMEEVTPTKRGAKREAEGIAFMQRNKVASYSMAKLSPAVVATYRDHRLKTVGAGTIIRELCILSSVISHARREWSLPISNPCELVRKPATPLGRSRLLSVDEEVKLLDELKPRGRRSPWMVPLVMLALETAMRRGELLGLRWEHIDLEKQTAFLPLTKNGTVRTVPLSKRAVAILADLPRCVDGRVFQLTDMGMEAAFRKGCARAEIVNLHFHDLRHTATSRLAEKLPNVIELAAVTGHQTIQMLKRYYHPKAEALAKKLD